MHIVLATDENYVQHCAVTMASVLANADAPADIRFYILSADISTANQAKLKHLTDRYDAGINFYRIDHAQLGDVQLRKAYSAATYYRLKIASLLPATVDKALYLDSDVIVVKDIADLYNTQLDDAYVAAVEEPDEPNVVRRKEKLGIAPQFSYFNAGVMLLNLKKWRADNIEDKLFAFLQQHKEKLEFMDQCVLNGVLHKDVRPLPPHYNFNDVFYSKKLHGFYKNFGRQEIYDARRNFTIRHFINKTKPWFYLSYKPHVRLYMHYIKLTPWADYGFPDKTFKNRIKRLRCLFMGCIRNL